MSWDANGQGKQRGTGASRLQGLMDLQAKIGWLYAEKGANLYHPMKSLKFIITLLFASALTLSVAQAGEAKGECKDKSAESCCECGVDKDGKVCGKDKECCCAAKKKDGEGKKECEAPKK